jgi:hypothetical protein
VKYLVRSAAPDSVGVARATARLLGAFLVAVPEALFSDAMLASLVDGLLERPTNRSATDTAA